MSTTKDGRADMTNFEMDLFDTSMKRWQEKEPVCKHSIVRPACVPVTVIALFIVLLVFFPLFNEDNIDSASIRYEKSGVCRDLCEMEIVESIPTGLTYKNTTPSKETYVAWMELVKRATKNIDIAAFYWNLIDQTGYPTSWKGNNTFNGLIEAAKKGVKLNIAQNKPSQLFPQTDSAYLAKNGFATVRSLDFDRLLGSGVLHTKFWIVDNRDVYIGSANMDWKSLTEVKELGYVFYNCSCLANDLSKVFKIYWKLGEEKAKIPPKWPLYLKTPFNFSHPLKLNLNGHFVDVFISSSPVGFNSKGREHDADAIVSAMRTAQRFVHIAVMDYLPAIIYEKPHKDRYWSILDDAIRAAAYRGVEVKLLVSHWAHSRPQMIAYLLSLEDINEGLPHYDHNVTGSIRVGIFTVPSTKEQLKLPFARVNHNKYMVTDQVAYVGTSNWVGDYFVNTAGVGVTLISEERVSLLEAIFQRDWNSPFTKPLH
ncbi:hypothetical protein AB6A40_003889 [Gnathostoma spinigerum]|uniref:PLD phosphodiesterase domain-containing protein n=1 Tax=Gnathostoma spinigerum TaxID=75299 RepID=A0ABD6EAW3_9BILA